MRMTDAEDGAQDCFSSLERCRHEEDVFVRAVCDIVFLGLRSSSTFHYLIHPEVNWNQGSATDACSGDRKDFARTRLAQAFIEAVRSCLLVSLDT